MCQNAHIFHALLVKMLELVRSNVFLHILLHIGISEYLVDSPAILTFRLEHMVEQVLKLTAEAFWHR